MSQKRLIVFAGRPGAGKTTLARALATEFGALYLRIDSIEDGLRASALKITDLMDGGYAVGRELATDALLMGHLVVVDAVNPDRECRQGWDAVASDTESEINWVFVTCSDAGEHLRRITERHRSGQKRGADWSEISTRNVEGPGKDWLTVDTADMPVSETMSRIAKALQISRR